MTDEVPQVVGHPYLLALSLLRGAGQDPIGLRVTKPPRAVAGRGQLRVIQQRQSAGRVDLTVAYEDYEDRARHES